MRRKRFAWRPLLTVELRALAEIIADIAHWLCHFVSKQTVTLTRCVFAEKNLPCNLSECRKFFHFMRYEAANSKNSTEMSSDMSLDSSLKRAAKSHDTLEK